MEFIPDDTGIQEKRVVKPKAASADSAGCQVWRYMPLMSIFTPGAERIGGKKQVL